MPLRSLGWFFMMVFSTLIVVIAARYLRLDPSLYFEDQREVFMRRESMLFAHVAGAMLALLVGPWQFVARLRRASLRTHRALGVVYVSGCIIGGCAGIALATTAHGGIVSSLGFLLLGTAWLATTALAVRAIITGNVLLHWRWMVRSFSLCFAAVTLRLYLGIFGGLDAAGLTASVTFTSAYIAISWMCWIPNLVIGWRISLRVRETPGTS